jgi:hypothetical protein
MYEPNSGINIPRFTVPDVPELEKALNSLSDAIQKTASKTKSFESSSDIRAVDNGTSVFFELLDQNKGYKPRRFELFYDKYNSKLFVYEGTVSLKINGVDQVVVPTIDKVKILLPESPGYEQLGIDFPAAFNITNQLAEANSPVWRVYLKVLLSAEDEKDRVSLILHNYTESGHPSDTIQADLFFEIGEIFNTNEITYINQKWSSDITLPALTECYFRITDVSEPGESEGDQLKLKVRVAQSKVQIPYAEERYPNLMTKDDPIIKDLTVSTDWLAVYIKIKFNPDNNQVLEDAEAVEVVFLKEYAENTYDTQYELIGEITRSYDESSHIYISSIINSCKQVVADYHKLKPYCNFEVSDATEYPEEGWPDNSEFKLRIRNAKVSDRYPDGMVENQEFKIDVPEELLEKEDIYIYIKIMLDEYGVVQEYDKAVTVEVTPYWLSSGSCIQRIPVARVRPLLFNSGDGGVPKYFIEVENYCPLIDIKKPNSCSFEIEDASDSPQALKIQIKNGKIGGYYPIGMQERGNYQLDIDPDKDWYAVYAVLSIQDYVLTEGENSSSFMLAEEYMEDTEEVVYRLIGTLNVSSREDTTRYISFIENFCYVPEVGDVFNCPFKLSPAGERDEDGNYIEPKVKIANGKVEGRYPQGMTEGTEYILDLSPYESDSVLVYIYVEILVNELGLIYDGEEAITIRPSSKYLKSGSAIQRTLIGTAEVINENFNLIVVPNKIINRCPIVGVNALDGCNFSVEDATDPEDASNVKVAVKVGTVDEKYPDGMSTDQMYLYTLNDIQGDWAAMYLVIKLDYKGEFDIAGDGDCYIIASDKYLKSTAKYHRVLIAEVTISTDDENKKYVSYVQNYCPLVEAPGAEDCAFALVDASEEDSLSLLVRNAKVGDAYPDGMAADTMYLADISQIEGDWAILYLVIKLDYKGEFDIAGDGDCYIIASDKYLRSTGKYHRIPIGEITISQDESSNKYISYIQNYCPYPEAPGLEECAFATIDSSEDGATSVIVRNGQVDKQYPSGMSADTVYEYDLSEIQGDWAIIYLVIKLNYKGEFDIQSDGDFYIEAFDTYKKSNAKFLYTAIAEITISEDDDGNKYASYIQNYCPEPKPPGVDECAFSIGDASEDGTVVVTVNNGEVDGKYPDGMSTEAVYEYNLSEIQGDWAILYLVIKLDYKGEFDIQGEGDCYIEAFDTYKNSNGKYLYTAIGEVTISTGEDNKKYVSYIQNYCPYPEAPGIDGCAFSVIDSSEDTNVSVIVRNGQVDGNYPDGMSADTLYEYNLSQIQGDWAILYLVIKLDYKGEFDIQGEGDCYIEAFDTYKRSNAKYLYTAIAEVTISTNEDNKKYVSYIQNYCPEPKAPGIDNCAFSIVDASEGNTVAVVVRNGKVDDKYPDGMSGDTLYEYNLSQIQGDWAILYLVIKLDYKGEFDIQGDGDFYIQAFDTYKNSNGKYLYTAIGEVTISTDEENKKYVSYVQNYCPYPEPLKPDNCAFSILDASEDNTVAVIIRNGQVDGQYPDGMSTEAAYEYNLSQIQGDWAILYLVIKLDYKGEFDISGQGDCYIEAFDTYKNSNGKYLYTAIGEVTISQNEQGNSYVSYIQNYCPYPEPPGLETCAFAVVDATVDGNVAVIVRNGKVSDRYPSGMSANTLYELPLGTSEWYAIYCGMKVDSSGKILEGDANLWIESTDEGYKENTSDTYYVLLAEVNVGSDEASNNVITYIQNYCVVPEPPAVTSAANDCLFKVLDWSDESGLKVKVSNAMVEGAYPSGMSASTDYILNVPNDSEYMAVYFVAMLNEDFSLSQENGSMYFETSDSYIESTCEKLYTLVAEVNVSTDSENGRYISFIRNYCNYPSTRLYPTCPFEIFSASNDSPLIQIRNGTVKGNYPEGMAAGDKYQMDVSGASWYAIYLVIKVDEEGEPKTEEGSLKFEKYNTYKKSTATTKYFLIGEVSISSSGEGGSKVSYIVNSCDTPQFLGYGSGSGGGGATCPFSLSDASTESDNGALTLQVGIASGLVEGRYPSGMGLGFPDYVIAVTENCYIYMKLAYKEDDVELLEEEEGITIEVSTTPKKNTVDVQYELIGTVVISTGGPSGGSYISKLTSVCGGIYAKPCSLAWT